MKTLTGILDFSERASPAGGTGQPPPRLRTLADSSIITSPDDPVVPALLCSRFGLRPGLEVTVNVGENGSGMNGHSRDGGNRYQDRRGGNGRRDYRGGGAGGGPDAAGASGARGAIASIVADIVAIEGEDPASFKAAKRFEDLTSIDPQPRLTLEYPGCPASCRLIDLFCPIGRGQRQLIVSPPKAGKTTLLKDIALALLRNHKDLEICVLLVDERPEEVTDFRRTFIRPPVELAPALAASDVASRVRVVASSNDHDVARHIAVSTMTIERCKRMAERGKHVVVLLDSLTRLSRAFNNSRHHASSGRTMTGGLDSRALEVPKSLFGAARNTEEAGSLTIIASCLVDTGSAADQVIFEEFKGTGNSELVLDRKIADRRVFPAINLAESGTRKENLLLNDAEFKTMTALRRRLLQMPPHVQAEQLLAALKRFPTNGGLVGSVS
jgi:transcription termination factor Rho